ERAVGRKKPISVGFSYRALGMKAGKPGIVGCGAYGALVGAPARPAVVSRPADLSSSQRLRLMSDHLLVGCRGVNLRVYRSSSRRLTRLSIHPKHSASRTESSYGMDSLSVCRL